MSTRHNNLIFGEPDNPREVELIQNIKEKTQQGKIPWVKQANALTATIPGGFQINFVVAPTISIVPPSLSWQLLTVRDKSGSELVRVNNGIMISVLTGRTGSQLVAAAEELFRVVNGVSADDLDRAINTIKNL